MNDSFYEIGQKEKTRQITKNQDEKRTPNSITNGSTNGFSNGIPYEINNGIINGLSNDATRLSVPSKRLSFASTSTQTASTQTEKDDTFLPLYNPGTLQQQTFLQIDELPQNCFRKKTSPDTVNVLKRLMEAKM